MVRAINLEDVSDIKIDQLELEEYNSLLEILKKEPEAGLLDAAGQAIEEKSPLTFEEYKFMMRYTYKLGIQQCIEATGMMPPIIERRMIFRKIESLANFCDKVMERKVIKPK